MAYNYFNLDHAIQTHDKIIEVSGGSTGEMDIGRLDSVLDHIQNDDYYPSFEEKTTHLVYEINKGHCFSDGNKRTSIALGAFFLEVNGLDGLVIKFIIEMENIAVSVADNLIDKQLLHEIITSIINEEHYSEELQMKIIASLEQ